MRRDPIEILIRFVLVPPVEYDALNRKDHIKVIWMQEGIYNEETEKKAKENGKDVVYNSALRYSTSL
jgi:uncharacterized protein